MGRMPVVSSQSAMRKNSEYDVARGPCVSRLKGLKVETNARGGCVCNAVGCNLKECTRRAFAIELAKECVGSNG